MNLLALGSQLFIVKTGGWSLFPRTAPGDAGSAWADFPQTIRWNAAMPEGQW